jgi:hypothetical protein
MSPLRRAPLAAAAAALFLLLPGTRAPAQDAPIPAPAPSVPAKAPTAPVAPKGPAIPWKPGEHGKGRLEVLPSGLAVLHVAGTPEEMGEQHGLLLKDAVRALVKDYLPKVLRGARENALARARLLEKRIPERHLREMKALAKAAEVEYDDILLGSVVVELFGLNMCSGAAASGPATADGRTIVGRNLEWPDHGILGQYGLVIAARPEGRRPFLSAGFPALTGVVTGMNGDGLFTAELVVMNGPPTDAAAALKGVPYPILQRRILEECGTLEAAKALVAGSPRTVAQNLLLADPVAGAVLECGADRCTVRPQKGGIVAVTNYYDEADAPPAGDPRYAGLCERFAAMASEKVTADSMEEAVRGASDKGLAAMLNLQCGVFCPGTLEVRVSLGRPPAAKKPMTTLDGAKLLGVTAPAARAAPPKDPPR